ncbi:MAG: DUF1439 domain-containing protein, partial [Deltaproteobacteria bacterium]|nr:DUF1439 domain-containing protein [Deltaproteobacteria bacterium]
MMNKRQWIAGIVFLLWLPLAAGCAGMQVEIPRAKVQEKVEKKFPIERNVLVAKAKLSDPKVYFEEGEVGIKMKFRASFLNRKVKGKADVRGTIAFDPDKKRFFVEEMRIVEVDTGKLKLSELGELKNIVSRLVAKRLDGMVVYTLD